MKTAWPFANVSWHTPQALPWTSIRMANASSVSPYPRRRLVRLQRQLFEQTVVLRRAAKGDTTAFAQVDGAIQKVLTLRAQLEARDRDLFAELSAGLSPAKKARLALAMAHLPQQMREMAQERTRR